MPTWVQLADGSWLNMANVNAVRRERGGKLRLEFIGEHGIFVDQHRRISNPQDVALIETYLARFAYTAPEPRQRFGPQEGTPEMPTQPLPKTFPSSGMQG